MYLSLSINTDELTERGNASGSSRLKQRIVDRHDLWAYLTAIRRIEQPGQGFGIIYLCGAGKNALS